MLLEHLERLLATREAQGLRRRLRTAHSPCGPRQLIAQPDGPLTSKLVFCSNDYLGLAGDPALTDALAEGARRYGAGSGASHLINGHVGRQEPRQRPTAVRSSFAPAKIGRAHV